MEECKNKYNRFLNHIRNMVKDEDLSFYNHLTGFNCEQFIVLMREQYKNVDKDGIHQLILNDFLIQTGLTMDILDGYDVDDVDKIYRYITYFHKIITII